MLSRNLIHSALLLVGAWAGIAGFYLWAGAEFVAFAQVLIYVGAVSMVVLFAVLLTRQGATAAPVEFGSAYRLGAGVLISSVLGSPLTITTKPAPAAVPVKQLGVLLMGPHAPALLITGVILTVALLGAIVIASGDRDAAKPEDTP